MKSSALILFLVCGAHVACGAHHLVLFKLASWSELNVLYNRLDLLLPFLAILVNITLRYLPLVPINSTIMVSRIWFLSDPCPEHFSDTQPLPPLLSFVLFFAVFAFLSFLVFLTHFQYQPLPPLPFVPLSSAEKFNLTLKIGPQSPHTHSSIVKSGGICVWYNKEAM